MTYSKPSRRDLLGGASVVAVAAVTAKKGVAFAQESVAAPDLSGKSVLITGTSSGFGRASALHFSRLGANVIASMRNYNKGKRPEAQELSDIAAQEKLKLQVVEIDVLDKQMVRQGVAKAEEIAGGALDVVVNNAGISSGGPVELQDEDMVELMFETNVQGYHRVTRAALPAMRRRGEGLVIAVSSQLGRTIVPIIGVYPSTKFAVEAMFESMAYELTPFGVDVTIIQPGGYPTKIGESARLNTEALHERIDEARKAAYADHIERSQFLFSAGGTTDPYDVPRAIAEVIAMPAGKRPLRRPVHPTSSGPTKAANSAMAEIQASILGGGAFKDWHARVVD